MNAAQLMDEQYRYQRYVYDWSRKYYLLGRDSLLKEIKMGFNDNLLESERFDWCHINQMNRNYKFYN